MKTDEKTWKTTIYRAVTALLLLGWMAVIFWFSDQPAVESSEMSGSVSYRFVEACSNIFGLGFSEETTEAYAAAIEHPVRKAAHMTEYAILGWLFLAVFRGYLPYRRKTVLFALAATAAYASTDEIHQLFIEGRAGRFGDVCIDTFGALLGFALLHFVLLCYGKHCEKQRHPLK